MSVPTSFFIPLSIRDLMTKYVNEDIDMFKQLTNLKQKYNLQYHINDDKLEILSEFNLTPSCENQINNILSIIG